MPVKQLTVWETDYGSRFDSRADAERAQAAEEFKRLYEEVDEPLGEEYHQVGGLELAAWIEDHADMVRLFLDRLATADALEA